MSVTTNYIRQEATRLNTIRKKAAKGFSKGTVMSGPKMRKLRIKA